MNMPISKYLATAALASFLTINGLFAASTKDMLEGERLGDIPFEERMYTKADVDYLLSLLKPGGGGGGDCNCTNQIRRYPMFILHLNIPTEFDEHGQVTKSTYFSGFELKASTNDFSHAIGTTENTRLLFWCASHMYAENHPAVVGGDGGMDSRASMLVFMCESYPDDYRAWVPIHSENALTLYPEYVAIILDIEKFTRTPDNTWCDSKNDEIVWSFMRFTNDSCQKGTSGYPVWNPIQPVKWLKDIPNWVIEKGYYPVID